MLHDIQDNVNCMTLKYKNLMHFVLFTLQFAGTTKNQYYNQSLYDES